jgi:hypothetical protein
MECLSERGVRRVICEPDDPLFDPILLQCGAYPDPDFYTDDWFYAQHLVASVSVMGSDEDHSFHDRSSS